MSKEKHQQDLQEIRSLMEQSTRFLSLSGWSGIMAGVYSLFGAYFIQQAGSELPGILEIISIGIGVMVASLITGFVLTLQKAKKNNQEMFSKTALRMLVHIGFPMSVGALFLGALLNTTCLNLTAGILLIFYGLGLINGSKYTLHNIRVLGVSNVILGVIALYLPQHGLLLWAAGFGIGHIIYGTFMWLKYERA
ncbi:MAG: hypothetical protein ACPGTP_00410 [Bacteroidia bacterium]